MRWTMLAAGLLAACLAAGCKGRQVEGDADAEADADLDSAAEPDPAPDPGPDVEDVPWEPVDVDDEEVVAICGNMVVEPGEECDPPGVATTCWTTCSSPGTGECTDECHEPGAADCTPPDETCNLMDDDCDGLVDEGTIGAWSTAATLGPAAAASAPTVEVAWTGDGFAAAWVQESTPDVLHMAVVDPLGETVTADRTIPLTAGDVSGRPALTWTGSNLMLAWNTTASRMHVAVVDAAGAVVSHRSVDGVDLGPSPDLAWSGSHAALAWVERVDANPEVHLGFLGADGLQEGSPVHVTSGATPRDPDVDATGSAVALAWTDARTGSSEVHRAVYGHDATPAAADAALTTTGGVCSPFISASHRVVAWSDDRDGTPRVYTLALDTTWSAAGAEASVLEGSTLALASSPARLGLAVGADLLTLGLDGLASSAAATLALDAASALEWGDLGAGAAGPSGPDLVLAFAGCAGHESCDAWTGLLAPLETRTGYDMFAHTLGHDAAIEGSFTSRPVSYLSIQIYQDAPYYGPDSSGTLLLSGTPYETCGLCVLVLETCGASTCARTYLARSGTLRITSIGTDGERFAGVLHDLKLAEVTIDSTTRTSTWVEDGREICIGHYTFDETID